jgi:hypothetical protein
LKDTEKILPLKNREMFNTILTQHRQAIRLYSNRAVAGQALDQLVLSGFPIAQVFLLGESEHKDHPANLPAPPYGRITGTATGLKKGLLMGNLAGGATGLLLGAGLIALPGVGQLVLSSAIAFVLLSGGICTAAGGVTGALIGLGLTSAQAKAYSQQIAGGSFLLIVEGTPQEIDRAEHLLHNGYN